MFINEEQQVEVNLGQSWMWEHILERCTAPPPGDVASFYAEWGHFSTAKSFAWAELYNLGSAPNRCAGWGCGPAHVGGASYQDVGM